MMNSTMNRQQRKTVHTDMNSMMISLQHNNLILRPNLKPKTTSHSQNQTRPQRINGLNSPLSIQDFSIEPAPSIHDKQSGSDGRHAFARLSIISSTCFAISRALSHAGAVSHRPF